MLDVFMSFMGELNGIVWGPYMLALLVGTGVILTILLKGYQFKELPYAFKLMFKKSDKKVQGDISPFQALTTALSATIGTGNIVGVATAFTFGGPGAIFWMWIAALFGMATKYAEAVLAVKYRIVDDAGEMAGGPMYYIEKGAGIKWLAVLFAFFGAFAAFGIGNVAQVNSIVDVLSPLLSPAITTVLSPVLSSVIPVDLIGRFGIGVMIAILVAAVTMGGIKSIGRVTSYIVPFMAVFYFIAGAAVLLLNLQYIIPAISYIVSDAFTGTAVAGGAIGTVMRYGIARGVFSNEAGLGSAPIAAAAAKTDHPGRQGLISMTGTFIDTIIICSITGLALTIATLKSGLLTSGLEGAQLTIAAFNSLLPNSGWIITMALPFFAYTTILGWTYYGEKCLEYLASSSKIANIYRIIFVLVVIWGSTADLKLVWDIADTLNGAMAIPNLIGILLLLKVVVSETKDFQKIKKAEATAESTQE
ncbi:AGCS family alanine or glycine:cation symporter [Methanococcus voltae]|uniref:alanine/glycine:cation symporter family protein n=1 Tax=Methanococcus voltae TaxID=2188 RepID=UPI001AE6C802|nr:sodium:alanine symporter family protein [Methanococcus voltae]MBP2143041.1 AGCS family alanine or glycine:cation symporter [Methanococcus voltae]